MKRLSICVVTLLLTIIAVAQEHNYYVEAEQAFQRCEYAKAVKLYKIAYAMTGRDTSAKQKLSNECAEAQRNAREQKSLGNNTAAKMWYIKILEANPNDAEARTYIENKSSNTNVTGRDFVETAAGLNMKMVWVEGGEFMMGATLEQGSDAESDEKPIRRVKLDSYYIGECEVTQAQWEKVMGTSIHQQANKEGGSSTYGTGPDYPMYLVSWEEAQAFCSELSRMTGRTYCLPTEAQWEYAARGGKKADGIKYSGSWSVDAVAWYIGNSGNNYHPVKNKRANGLGLYDMSGNAYEWCSDWYGDYNVNDTNNPTGPSSGSSRVLRGGSWYSNARNCRVSNRNFNGPSYRSYGGFRVALIP